VLKIKLLYRVKAKTINTDFFCCTLSFVTVIKLSSFAGPSSLDMLLFVFTPADDEKRNCCFAHTPEKTDLQAGVENFLNIFTFCFFANCVLKNKQIVV